MPAERRVAGRISLDPELLEPFVAFVGLETAVHDPELLAASPTLPEQLRALEYAVLRPITPAYAQLSDILQRQLSDVITGGLPAAQAMRRAGQASTLLLESTGGEAKGA